MWHLNAWWIWLNVHKVSIECRNLNAQRGEYCWRANTANPNPNLVKAQHLHWRKPAGRNQTAKSTNNICWRTAQILHLKPLVSTWILGGLDWLRLVKSTGNFSMLALHQQICYGRTITHKGVFLNPHTKNISFSMFVLYSYFVQILICQMIMTHTYMIWHFLQSLHLMWRIRSIVQAQK